MNTIDIAHPALLVIDMQRYFLERGADASLAQGPGIIPRVLSLIGAFRKAHLPIVFTRHAHRRDGPAGQMERWWRGRLPREGDQQSELIASIVPEPGEIFLTKTRYSAFEGTDLDDQLRSRGATTVVLCGVMTNLCVETTARHAFMKDFQPVVISDACAANDEAHHRAALLNLSYGFAIIETTESIMKNIMQQS